MGAKIELSCRGKGFEAILPVSEENICWARSRNPKGDKTWEELTRDALEHPIDDTKPVPEENLRGKKIAVIVDDKGRPTPAYRLVPPVLDALHRAGAENDKIVFVTAAGMHDPMTREELEEKLGKDTVNRFKCVAHDGGDRENLSFIGITELGTPIWINRMVAEADYKLALGRVFPHTTYGYEGGYKMILPGVSSFETITRDHSMNFAPASNYGNVENPSRLEAEAVGKMVGLNYTVNYVMNYQAEPIAAYGGDAIRVQRKCVEYGDREVWGATIGSKADVVIACPSPRWQGRGVDIDALAMARLAVKEGGAIILLVPEDEPEDVKPSSELRSLSMSELLMLHEKRTWSGLTEREVQWKLKAIRSEFYRRRALCDQRHRLVFAGGKPSSVTLAESKGEYRASLQDAIDTLAGTLRSGIRIVVMPEADTTVPRIK